MYQWEEPEATYADYIAEAYAATIRDMELFNATEEELPATDAELASWATADMMLRLAGEAEAAAALARGDLPF